MAQAICASCMHSRHIIKNRAAPNVWYNWFCSAAPREATVDPVSGESGYAGKNDLGGNYVTEDPWEYCRNINTNGQCRMFRKNIEFVVAEGD